MEWMPTTFEVVPDHREEVAFVENSHTLGVVSFRRLVHPYMVVLFVVVVDVLVVVLVFANPPPCTGSTLGPLPRCTLASQHA